MWKLIVLAAAVGALASPATAAGQIQIKGSDTGTFSLAPTDTPAIFVTTDVSSGVASHLGHYDLLAHETYDAIRNVVTQASFTLTTKHGTLSGNYTATLGFGATPNILTYHAPGSITGGTGRYAGATGTIVFDGFGDLLTLALEDHLRATIVLPDDRDDLVAAALTAPPAAQADSSEDDALRIRLVPPVNFAPTADCPTGAAIYGISLHQQAGSGTNCILGELPAECPPNVTAQFCQNVPVRMKLSLPGGSIEADVTIFEAWTCNARCAVDQRWSGTVTRATRRFHRLEDGSVSGGGLFVFDPVTFDLTLDEVLVITPPDENDE